MAIDGLFSGDVTLIVPGYPGFASLIILSPLLEIGMHGIVLLNLA